MIWIVTRRQYGSSALVSQTSFRTKTSSGAANYQLFSQGQDKLGCRHLDNRAMLFAPWGFFADKMTSPNFDLRGTIS